MASNTSAATTPRALRDPVLILPAEVISNAFRRLNFVGRLGVSHVSTAWRKVALADRHLWARYVLTLQGGWDRHTKKATGALVELLARSDPLPFDFRCAPSVPNPISKILIEYMHRMGVLELGMLHSVSVRRRMLELDAPRLTRFSCWGTYASDSPLPVPARWARHLERMELRCACVWVAGCVFGCLRTFSGHVPEGRGFGGSIAHCFPKLEILKLERATQAQVDSLAPFPRSLTTLTLHATLDVDCVRLLDGNHTQGIRELDIRTEGTAASVFNASRAFTRTVNCQWTLEVTENVIQLRAPQFRYEITCTESSWLSRLPSVSSFWGALCELHLPLSDYVQFLGAGALAVDLPVLALAGFVVRPGDNIRRAFPDGVRVCAPSLHCIVLAINREFDAVNTLLVRILWSFVGRTRILGDVVVVTEFPYAFGKGHFDALGSLVARVQVQNPGGKVISSNVLILYAPDLELGRVKRDRQDHRAHELGPPWGA